MTTSRSAHRAASDPSRLSLDAAVPDVLVLHVTGPLDRGSGARLLRLVDARLALVRAGTRGARDVRHVVVDLAGSSAVDAAGAAALRHARYACGRLGIRVHLAGGTRHGAPHTARIRDGLAGFGRFPTAGCAVAELSGGPGDRS